MVHTLHNVFLSMRLIILLGAQSCHALHVQMYFMYIRVYIKGLNFASIS